MTISRAQRLPTNWYAREKLREKGQFWTPAWVAEAMVGYVLGASSRVFDPAVGAGAFLLAAKDVAAELGKRVRFSGLEIDPAALAEARSAGAKEADLAGVRIGDFVMSPPKGHLMAIVANPPYIRHHRLTQTMKASLREIAIRTIGTTLDGRAGLHIYFLVRALTLLGPRGRLAFIVPADTCEGVFAPTLWRWIARNHRIDAIVTFTPEATPFPKVDTNPIILLLRRQKPRGWYYWVQCRRANTDQLKKWVLSGFKAHGLSELLIQRRRLTQGLALGLAREASATDPMGPTLGDFAGVMRGIATGANNFFFLTENQVREFSLARRWLLPAVGRTRDVPDDQITEETLQKLAEAGRPTLLFSPDGRHVRDFPAEVREYLRRGEAQGVPGRPLVSQRRPWYKMEAREAPPFLFAYLGRRNSRFIRNRAWVVPLTGFLCVYPKKSNDPEYLEKLWRVLSHPRTIGNLPLVGKSYGSGAIKVEPRALERLPLPVDILQQEGLESPKHGIQMALFG